MMKRILLLILYTVIATDMYALTDKFRLMIAGDPATSVTIGWNQLSGNNPVLLYDTQDYGTNYTLYTQSKTVDRSVSYRGMDNRFVRLTGLQPNTAYYFVVLDDEGISYRYWFKTAPNDLSRLSFIAGGDSRNNRTPRQSANLLVSKLKPHAVFFGGDMTDDDTDTEWQNWFDDWQLTTSADGRMIPVIAARGNHESQNQVIYNLFDVPSPEAYYATTFGDNMVRFYTLNSQISVSGNQLTWLENDLSTHTDALWKMAQYHKPMRPHTLVKSEGSSMYSAWAQLFFDYGVRLVIDCDSHMSKTTWPIEPSSNPGNDEGFIINQTLGTVYTGEGCWGAPLRPNDDTKSWTRSSGSFNQFKLIFVDTSKIELRTIKVDNASQVGEVSNTDPFTLPANLDLNFPSSGAVVEITPVATGSIRPNIQFSNSAPEVYLSNSTASLSVDILNPGNGIEKVDFYVNDIFVETDSVAPYTLTGQFADGEYTVIAVASTIEQRTDSDEISIYVGNYSATVAYPVLNGDDDVEERESGSLYLNSSDLELVYDNSSNGFQKIGLRFQRITIPIGAVIDDAYIQFRSDEANSERAELNVFIEDTADAQVFEDNATANVSGRTKLSNPVLWEPPEWGSSGLLGTDQQAQGLANLVQQIINKDDWTPGNSIAAIIEGTGESLTNTTFKRVADSYEGSSEFAPTLHITYTFNAGNVNCLPDLGANSTPIPDGAYRAKKLIYSTGTVPQNGDVIFRSGDVIIMDKNFKVEPSGALNAEIEDCN